MIKAMVQLDEALERVVRLRERLLAESEAPGRAERLALLFESEARAWSQVFELSSDRLVWRAALAAELVARQQARAWRRRAAAQGAAPVRPTTQTPARVHAVGVGV